ncbi:MAG: response regulator transcription factor [Deinococcales bacterium]
MMAATVLLVEDETSVREAVRFHLERSGYTVRAHATALEAWDNLSGSDVIVLDWMLPDEAGISWLRRLRDSNFAQTPVLMLTARASEVDRIEGLDAGADDYLTKPFSAAELAARVRALLRRSGQTQKRGFLRVGELELSTSTGTAKFAGQELSLTRREFDLLAFLAANPGRVYSRQELLDKVWGVDFIGGERTVDQHITQLRAHLGDEPTEPAYLETVRGKGYRMRAEP